MDRRLVVLGKVACFDDAVVKQGKAVSLKVSFGLEFELSVLLYGTGRGGALDRWLKRISEEWVAA